MRTITFGNGVSDALLGAWEHLAYRVTGISTPNKPNQSQRGEA
jgi:hypothetical protein